MPTSLRVFCRTATPFSPVTGELDEEALRRFLQTRFIDHGIGVYLGSAGSGESHALTRDELQRLYRIGVETCKGKVPVYGNPPERHSARKTREQLDLAIAAGVEAINVYGPAAWHAYRPTDAELTAYYDTLLKDLRCPVALAPLPILGYMPKASLLADICHRHSQVIAVNLSGVSDAYFVEMKATVNRDIQYYVPLAGSLNTLSLGAAGLMSAEAHIAPRTLTRYLELFAAGGRTDELNRCYTDLTRITQYLSQWNTSPVRWVKMAMKAFKMPGGEGGLREPYRNAGDAEVKSFVAGLLALGVPEIDAQARAAGLR